VDALSLRVFGVSIAHPRWPWGRLGAGCGISTPRLWTERRRSG